MEYDLRQYTIPKQSRLSARFAQNRNRAARKGIDWLITYDEWSKIERPVYCPLLNIKLCYTNNNTCDNSPTLDRIDNDKGYQLDNLWFISHKANRIKTDATVGEIMMVALNLRKRMRGP